MECYTKRADPWPDQGQRSQPSDDHISMLTWLAVCIPNTTASLVFVVALALALVSGQCRRNVYGESFGISGLGTQRKPAGKLRRYARILYEDRHEKLVP